MQRILVTDPKRGTRPLVTIALAAPALANMLREAVNTLPEEANMDAPASGTLPTAEAKISTAVTASPRIASAEASAGITSSASATRS